MSEETGIPTGDYVPKNILLTGGAGKWARILSFIHSTETYKFTCFW